METSFGDLLFVLDQQHVEKVQKRATRLVHDLRDHTYNSHRWIYISYYIVTLKGLYAVYMLHMLG